MNNKPAKQNESFKDAASKDMKSFADLFDCIHCKFLPQGLEVRVLNLDAGKHDAMRLIKRRSFNLEVVNDGNMVAQRAFLVRSL